MALAEWRFLDNAGLYHVKNVGLFPEDGFVIVVDISKGCLDYRYLNDPSRTIRRVTVGYFIDHAFDVL